MCVAALEAWSRSRARSASALAIHTQAALLMSPTRAQFEKAVGGPAAMDQLLSIRPALDDLREGIWAKFRKEGLAAKME